jgi:hypothetical protein
MGGSPDAAQATWNLLAHGGHSRASIAPDDLATVAGLQ